MDHNDLAAVWVTLGMFGGTALIIWTSVQAKIARIKAEGPGSAGGGLAHRGRGSAGRAQSAQAADGRDAQHQPPVRHFVR